MGDQPTAAPDPTQQTTPTTPTPSAPASAPTTSPPTQPTSSPGETGTPTTQPPATPLQPNTGQPEALAQLTQSVQELAAIQRRNEEQRTAATTQPPAPQFPHNPTDDEIAQAVEDGNGKLYTKLSNQREAYNRAVNQHELNTRLQQGYTEISSLTRNQILDGSQRYRENPEVQADVEKFLDMIRAQGVIPNADGYREALNSAIGKNIDLITQREAEAKVRQQAQDAASAAVPGNVQRTARTHGTGADGEVYVPTLDELGDDARMALSFLDNGRGKDLDRFVQDLPPRRVVTIKTDPNTGQQFKVAEIKRYKDWADYCQQAQAGREILAAQQQRYLGPFAGMY